MLTVYFSQLRADAVIPSKRHEDAGYDIYPCIEEDYVMIPAHTTVKIPTGIASAFSSEYYIQFAERGSTGTRGIAQRCGVIDSGYRGEWFIPVTNTNPYPLYIAKAESVQRLYSEHKGERFDIYPAEKAICQALVLPVPQTQIVVVSKEELEGITSERSKGCLGSSNK